MTFDYLGFQLAINEDELQPYSLPNFENIKLRRGLGLLEKEIGFIIDLKNALQITHLYYENCTHGGIVPLSCHSEFKLVNIVNTSSSNISNVKSNVQQFQSKGINNIYFDMPPFEGGSSYIRIQQTVGQYGHRDVMITKTYSNVPSHTCFKFESMYVYVPPFHIDDFCTYFKHDKGNDTLQYDNLLEYAMIIKDAGSDFKKVLAENSSHIDHWTILDTGSTDGSQEVVKETLKHKIGKLYEEPFIDFKQSRNRCLDLAGTRCKFVIMLDDTYIIRNNLRLVLNTLRDDADHFASYSLYIASDDITYVSNRIIKTRSNIRYIFGIHEVFDPTNNQNFVIPKNDAYIEDVPSEYMTKRTFARKQKDIELLNKEIEEDPNNPRHWYYLGQTYKLLDQYEKACECLQRRIDHPNEGYIHEKMDAIFELARIKQYQLKHPWDECRKLHDECIRLDPLRPDSYYFIGLNYYSENNYREAYPYMKKAFDLGFPKHGQFSLRPTISYLFVPYFLARICYLLDDYKTGEECCKFYLANQKPTATFWDEMVSWTNIFTHLNKVKWDSSQIPFEPITPIVVFIADGGFNNWSGKNIVNHGVGGAETHTIEMAGNIQKSGRANVFVFCRTDVVEIFRGVTYLPLSMMYEFLMSHYIHTCIISRYSEYVPMALKAHTENVYLFLHDLTPSGVVIPSTPKLKNVFCLTEWHVAYFSDKFSTLKDITKPMYYGIDTKLFYPKEKVPFRFIYSSFPNRGLKDLLKIWKRIVEKYPSAELFICSDVDGKWANDNFAEEMKEIRELLKNSTNIQYKGWVSKKELASIWQSSDIWLYPTSFMETFCLTALEAAATKTFPICTKLAALENTVGDRGVLIEGDPSSEVWIKKALEAIDFYCVKNPHLKTEYINKNYEWARTMTWMNQANKFMDSYLFTPDKNLHAKNMLNWTHNIPSGTKEVMENTLDLFSNNEAVRILEIGTYTGTSIISMLNRLPKATGVVIDPWKAYNESSNSMLLEKMNIERSFYHNMKVSNTADRITVLKGMSNECLISLIRQNSYFDFIYVDGDHRCLNCYLDCSLSWHLLKPNGVMAIDDYLFTPPSGNDDWLRPQKGVDQFLEEISGKYELLHKGYRIIIQKID